MPEPKSLPRAVARGARLGLFALSGPVPERRVAAGMTILRDLGFAPLLAPNARERAGYLAGGDDARLEGLEWLLDNGAEALLAVRGGYGIHRLLERLPYQRLGDWGGWIAGFSDVTALHCALSRRAPHATLHGPMTTTLSRHGPSTARLVAWLEGRAGATLFRVNPGQVVRGGRARGVSVGGNLALLAALEGTAFAPVCDGGVLFLEDVGEPLYRLDRMLNQLRLSSRLARVAAIVAGQLTECGRREPGWRARWHRLLLEVAPDGCVVLDGLPFGHGVRNLPIPLGVEVEIDTGRGTVAWGGAQWSR